MGLVSSALGTSEMRCYFNWGFQMENKGPTRLYKFPIKANKYHKTWYEQGRRLVDAGIKFTYRLITLRTIDGDIIDDVQGVHVTFETGADYTHFLLKFGNEQFGVKGTAYTHVKTSASNPHEFAGKFIYRSRKHL